MPFRHSVQVLFAGALCAGAAVVADPPLAGAAPAASTAARAWYGQVVADLQPLQTTLVDGLHAASGWQAGTESAAATGRAMTRDEPSLVLARAALERLRPLAGHQAVRGDYVAALTLYVEAFRLEQAATTLPASPLVPQLQLGFERIRELGDLTFDEGTAALAPLLGPSMAGADVAAAAHLPDWPAVGLAPGEPLLAGWQGTTAQPTGTQSASSWSAAVGSDGAPPQASLERALARPTGPAALAALAGALDRAEVRLSSRPAPAPDPQAAALERLALLVDAEGALAAEAGRLSTGATAAGLVAVGLALGAVGSTLRAG